LIVIIICALLQPLIKLLFRKVESANF